MDETSLSIVCEMPGVGFIDEAWLRGHGVTQCKGT